VLLYGLSCAAFCLLVLRLCGSVRVLAAVLPLLVVTMIALCPIFFDFRPLMALQMLFPPTYFVNAGHDDRWLWYMALYAVVCVLLALMLEQLIHWMHRTRGENK
jgi:hypothetical protein